MTRSRESFSSEPPRITVCHVITRLVRGGAQLVVLDLLRGLDRSRYDVRLVAGEETGAEGSLWPEVEALGLPLVRIPALVRAVRPWKDLQALRALRRHFAQTQPDIVHAHTSKAGLLGCVAARRAGVPGIVLAPHGHILGAEAQIPGVPNQGVKRRVLTTVARHNTRYANVVVCPNETERNDGIAHGLWRDDNSMTIGNGIDTERFQPRDRDSIRREEGWPLTQPIPNAVTSAPVIGVVARLSAEKGIEVAIDAVAQWPEATLVIVGDGPRREELQNQVSRAPGLGERVRFVGLRTDVERLMAAFDLLWVPSRTEAHGLVAAESLASGTPVIASDVGGLRSLVIGPQESDPATGTRVAPGDPRAFVAASKALITDPAEYRRRSEAGRRRMIDRFSLASMIAQTGALYDSLAVPVSV